jgi:hypothetical protein
MTCNGINTMSFQIHKLGVLFIYKNVIIKYND